MTSQIVAWLMLVTACLLIPHTWQERAARIGLVNSPWRSWWRFGSARRRAYLRSVVLDLNPMMWLGCRERWQSLWLWLVALLLVGWFMATTLIDRPFWNLAGWWAVNSLATLFLYLWTASQASQVFAELRRAGMMELLLAVPLDFRKLATGAWVALVRLFSIPIGIIVLVQFLAVVTGIGGGTSGGIILVGATTGLIPEWIMLWIGAGTGLLLSLANLVALTWFVDGIGIPE